MILKRKPNKDAKLIDVLNRLELILDRLHPTTSNLLWRRIVAGICHGIGLVIAFAVVLPLVIWALQTVMWAPFIGEIAAGVADRIEQTTTQPTRPAPSVDR